MLLEDLLQLMVWYLFVVMLEILTTGHSLVQEDGLILTFYPILKKWKLGMVTLMMNQKNTVVFQVPFISLEATRQTHYTKLLLKLVTKQVLKLHQTIMVLSKRVLVLWNKLSIKEEGGQLLTLI